VNRLLLRHFLLEENGQDFTEYALLLAFVALTSAAILIGMSDDAARIWSNCNSRLQAG
jgi:Flp pilus assembly pilin Flp